MNRSKYVQFDEMLCETNGEDPLQNARNFLALMADQDLLLARIELLNLFQRQRTEDCSKITVTPKPGSDFQMEVELLRHHDVTSIVYSGRIPPTRLHELCCNSEALFAAFEAVDQYTEAHDLDDEIDLGSIDFARYGSGLHTQVLEERETPEVQLSATSISPHESTVRTIPTPFVRRRAWMQMAGSAAAASIAWIVFSVRSSRAATLAVQIASSEIEDAFDLFDETLIHESIRTASRALADLRRDVGQEVADDSEAFARFLSLLAVEKATLSQFQLARELLEGHRSINRNGQALLDAARGHISYAEAMQIKADTKDNGLKRADLLKEAIQFFQSARDRLPDGQALDATVGDILASSRIETSQLIAEHKLSSDPSRGDRFKALMERLRRVPEQKSSDGVKGAIVRATTGYSMHLNRHFRTDPSAFQTSEIILRRCLTEDIANVNPKRLVVRRARLEWNLADSLYYQGKITEAAKVRKASVDNFFTAAVARRKLMNSQLEDLEQALLTNQMRLARELYESGERQQAMNVTREAFQSRDPVGCVYVGPGDISKFFMIASLREELDNNEKDNLLKVGLEQLRDYVKRCQEVNQKSEFDFRSYFPIDPRIESILEPVI